MLFQTRKRVTSCRLFVARTLFCKDGKAKNTCTELQIKPEVLLKMISAGMEGKK